MTWKAMWVIFFKKADYILQYKYNILKKYMSSIFTHVL